MRSGDSQALRTDGPLEQVLRKRVGARVNLLYRANQPFHGGYSPPCCHSRGMLFHISILTRDGANVIMT
jgi:hypothetical protein